MKVKLEILNTIIAILAFGIAAISLSWQIYNSVVEYQPRVDVKCIFSPSWEPKTGKMTGLGEIKFDVINTGRRDLYVEKVELVGWNNTFRNREIEGYRFPFESVTSFNLPIKSWAKREYSVVLNDRIKNPFCSGSIESAWIGVYSTLGPVSEFPLSLSKDFINLFCMGTKEVKEKSNKANSADAKSRAAD